MPENQDNLRETVVETARAAFVDGCGGAEITSDADTKMKSFWEQCFDSHEADIRKNWTSRRANVIKKVTAIGASASEKSKARDNKAPKVEYSDFEQARDEVNSGVNLSDWC